MILNNSSLNSSTKHLNSNLDEAQKTKKSKTASFSNLFTVELKNYKAFCKSDLDLESKGNDLG